MKSSSFLLRIILFSFLTISVVKAQGFIQGTISDSLTQKTLVGANVFIMGTSLGAATNIDGDYLITNIPIGKQSIKISYIGYKAKILEVEILNNKSTVLEIQLLPEVLEGEEVLITTQALGQISAINQQLNSNTIVNVISEERIQELPDANAAETIGHLPGVSVTRSGGEANKITLRGLSDKYSVITYDGFRIASTESNDRGVDLSTISQGSLVGIELYKALTPDKDADAIAGMVNLVTKKAPSMRLLRLDATGGYNQLEKSAKQYAFNLRYGERFFDDVLGLQLNGSIENKIRSNEATDLDYQYINNLTEWEITNSTLFYTNETRERYSINALLDVSTPDSGTIKLNTVYNKTTRDYFTSNRNYPSISSTAILFGGRSVLQDIETFNGFLFGDNYLLDVNMNWGLSLAKSISENPYDYQLDFVEPSILDSTGQPISGMKLIPSSLRHGPLESIIPYALNNLDVSYLYDAYDRYQKIQQNEHSAFLNLSRNYAFGSSIAGEFKIGGKYRSNQKDKNLTEFISPYYLNGFSPYEKLADGSIVLKDFSGTHFENLAYGGSSVLATNYTDSPPQDRNVYDLYNLNPLVNREYLELWRSLNINGVTTQSGNAAEYSRNAAVDADYYDITERISAGYLMNTLNLGSLLTFIAGIRVESENNDYATKYSPGILSGFPSPQGEIRDTSSTHQETNWLPNFQLLIRATDFLNIRLAAYRALARPDFNRRLPTYILRAAGTFYENNSITVGNPNLEDAKAWNYEVNTSFFSNYIGLFSVSGFYKEITDAFHTVNGITLSRANGQEILDSLGIPVTNPFVTDFQIQYEYNSDKPTKVWGFEVEHQINFWYLPGFLSNFLLNYNFSFIRSETYITSSTVKTIYDPFPRNVTVLIESKQKLEDQPDFFANISLGYDVGGFSSRISLFYQGEYNQTFSTDGTRDVIVNPFTRLDLILKQEIIQDHLSIMLNFNNLTNVQEGTRIVNRGTGWKLENETERYGRTAALVMRVIL
jgi:outer membrane receptor for ferrienterochelin and colicin